jgi:hypothetical protein
LSTALLQASQQLRFEAMPILFKTHVITVEWLLVLPKFVNFLGRDGLALVRYLDLWDTLNLQEFEKDKYQDILRSIVFFPCVQHLRIVVDSNEYPPGRWNNRTRSWFDTDEWTDLQFSFLKDDAIPKLRNIDMNTHWPEYGVLKTLKAQNFTLAAHAVGGRPYLEFDKNHGLFPELSRSIKFNASVEELPLGSDGEDFDGLMWQDTDALPSKAIAFYNVIREFSITQNYAMSVNGPLHHTPIHMFASFPVASKSKGRLMRDCAFCYLAESHCGYHAMPISSLFSPTLKAEFDDLSYVEMRDVCQSVASQVRASLDFEMCKKLRMMEYMGSDKLPADESLIRLDAVVEVGRTGKRVDKEEVPPWNLLYREFWAGGRL